MQKTKKTYIAATEEFRAHVNANDELIMII